MYIYHFSKMYALTANYLPFQKAIHSYRAQTPFFFVRRELAAFEEKHAKEMCIVWKKMRCCLWHLCEGYEH